MSSGIGRGRGWLNLNKNNPPTPGAAPYPANTDGFVNGIQPTNFCDMNNPNIAKYNKIVNQILQINVNDDGIMFNQKLRNIKDVWMQECKDAAEVDESFKYIFDSCLRNGELGTKLVAVFNTNMFKKLHVHDVRLRAKFITLQQESFENSKQLQKTNADAFRNTVKLFSEYYNTLKLESRNLANALIQYFYMLLDTPQPKDVQLFASQFYLNGSLLKAASAQEVNDLLIHVRHLMVYSTHLTTNCKLWLLLSLDVANHRFGLLPSELHDYYVEQLGDTAMAAFQGSPAALSVQTTYLNKSLDKFQSNVSVLQMSSASTSPTSEQDSMNPNSTSSNQDMSQTISSDSSSNTMGTWDPNREKKQEKTGRPILGAGARLNKPKPEETDLDRKEKNWIPSNAYWKDDVCWENSQGWDSKQKNTSGSGWNGSKKSQNNKPKNNKGWEHDDRFKNDYN